MHVRCPSPPSARDTCSTVWMRQGRRGEQRPLRHGAERVEAVADERVEGLGHDITTLLRPCELEREEGITARGPVQPAQRGPREPSSESPQNGLRCVEAQRLDLNALDPSRWQCPVEHECRVVPPRPAALR
jgi:hypothetical protein